MPRSPVHYRLQATRHQPGIDRKAVYIDEQSIDRDVSNPFDKFIGDQVVLDTKGTIVYLGRLTQVHEAGFVLTDADVHDCRDGHATKEVYINEAKHNGLSTNRRRVLVLKSSVISVSRLSDVVDQ